MARATAASSSSSTCARRAGRSGQSSASSRHSDRFPSGESPARSGATGTHAPVAARGSRASRRREGTDSISRRPSGAGFAPSPARSATRPRRTRTAASTRRGTSRCRIPSTSGRAGVSIERESAQRGSAPRTPARSSGSLHEPARAQRLEGGCGGADLRQQISPASIRSSRPLDPSRIFHGMRNGPRLC